MGDDSRGAPTRTSTVRLRAGLRRHGLIRRPAAIRSLVRSRDIRFTDGNRVELFDFGAAALQTMLEAIEDARDHVHLETYILRTDSTGRRFLDALARRAAAGVEIRLLYDALGSRELREADLAPLRHAGGEAVAFNRLVAAWPHFAPRRRDHRKILIADGRVAFTGGLNIGDEYGRSVDGEHPGWRDAHVRIEGPAVRDLGAVFLESWFRADGPALPWHRLLEAEPDALGQVRCAVLPDGPVYRRRRMRDLIASALAETHTHARLYSPYFLPDRRVLDALAAAARRGVEIDLVLAGPRTDHPVLRRAARSLLPRLLERGVRVLEYEGSMMHAKIAVFDGQWSVIGTSNLDRQSFEHSYEVNLLLEGGDVAARLDRAFESDRAHVSVVDEAALAARGSVDRALDWCAALLARLV